MYIRAYVCTQYYSQEPYYVITRELKFSRIYNMLVIKMCS